MQFDFILDPDLTLLEMDVLLLFKSCEASWHLLMVLSQKKNELHIEALFTM